MNNQIDTPDIVHYEEGNFFLLVITADRVTVQGCPTPTEAHSATIRALADKWIGKTHIHASRSGRWVSGNTRDKAEAANAIWLLLFGGRLLYPEDLQKAKAMLAPFLGVVQ